MLFDVEADQGSRIVAYVVPDSGSGTPSIRVRGDGVELLTLEANDVRPNLVAAGRHATGRCGFVLDETLLPGLARYSDLEITEASHDLLVYRRRAPQAIDGKIFRLETHLEPLDGLDAAIRDRFQYWYRGIDRMGLETSTQVFCLEAASIFVSGRLLLKNFEYYLVRGFKLLALLRDPFDELAARLQLLKSAGERAEATLSSRDAIAFATTISLLQSCDLNDPRECRRFFKRAPEEVLKALSNPLVRQLTTSAHDEMPSPSGVASALDSLAGFETLGLRSNAAIFASSLASLADIEPERVPSISEDLEVLSIASHLRDIPIVQDIIEKDLEVFYVVTKAFEASELAALDVT